jgi:metallo-beta-lactamase family protein
MLTFLGAVGTVTGRTFRVEHGGRRVLGDCGSHQGEREGRRRNWDPFPVPPRTSTTCFARTAASTTAR